MYEWYVDVLNPKHSIVTALKDTQYVLIDGS